MQRSSQAASVNNKKSIAIVIWGHIHRDPLAPQTLAKKIAKYHEQKYPLVFCEEDFAEQTLENKLEGNRQYIELHDKFISVPGIASLLKKENNLRYPHFHFSDIHKIEQALSQLNVEYISEYTTALLDYPALLESVQLAELLKRCNIPYLGIEFSQSQHQRMFNLAHNNKRNYVDFEQARISEMTNNIINKAIPKLSTGGIIFVYCGVNHAHRLAASIKIHSQHLLEKIDLKLTPVNFFSPYVYDGIPNFQETIISTANTDSAELRKQYEQIPCYNVVCKKDFEKSNQELELIQLEKDIVGHIAKPAKLSGRKYLLLDFLSTNDLNHYNQVSKIKHQISTPALNARKTKTA